MIASVLTLDHHAIQSLAVHDAYGLHKLIYSLFPGERREFLYLDEGGDVRGKQVLILSRVQPLVPQEGEIHSKRVPSGFLEHTSYAFSVKLNPVVRQNGKKRFIPVTGRENIAAWFARKQSDWGFHADSDRLELSGLGVEEIPKGEQTIVYNKATVKGILSVTDPLQFQKSFENGIGRGKSFGFGLLQLRPLENIQKGENT